MKFELWFSRRIRVKGGMTASAATGSIIAVAGVALAIMVMELSLVISTGFKSEIRAKVMGFEPAVSVLPAYNVDSGLEDDMLQPEDEIFRTISEVAPQARASEALSRQAILKTDDAYLAVKCVAHDENHDFAFEQSNLVEGNLPLYSESQDSVAISQDMSQRLGVNHGDKLYLYFFVDGDVKARRVFISGIYSSNFSEYDKSIVYAPMNLLRKVGSDSTAVTSIDIENIAPDEIASISSALQQAFVDKYRRQEISMLYPVTDVLRTGAIYFNWLDLLDTNVVVIFILMLCVASFTLISSLFIIILDRINTIGLLRALGTRRRVIGNIFLATALRLVGLGLIIGNIAGLGLALLQKYTHLMPLKADMYYLDHVPVEINWLYIAALNAGVIVIAWLTLILPARIASGVDPAATMRYE